MATLLSVASQELSIEKNADVNSDQSSLPKMTTCYQADQQVKYLHLQAEIEVLLQKLQTFKQQKHSS